MIQVSMDACCGCAACANSCPKACIEMRANHEGFLHPKVDTSRCVECGLCEKACPVLQSKLENTTTPVSYIAYNADREERGNSSSGGIFVLLAKKILEQGGVVFGAALTDDCYAVQHIAIENVADLPKIMRSKYLQSEIGDTYRKVKQYLVAGRIVLFAGTPCQVEALRCFLKDMYDNLLCVDFVCHGVPSQKLWERYVRYREQKDGNVKAKQISFRDKTNGWRDYSMVFQYTDGTKYCRAFEDDLYGQAFVRNVSLRRSCYQCQFRKTNRKSDLTIADAWGAESFFPEMFDNQGLSRIFVHTEKGAESLLNLKGLVCKEENGNSSGAALCSAPQKHPKRDEFYRHYMDVDFDRLVAHYAKPSMRKRMVYILRKLGVLHTVKGVLAQLRRRR